MKRNNKAFTLVEMLIVVVIIGILAAALIPRLIGAQSQARDTARLTGVGQIQSGLEVYYGREGTYPTATSTDQLYATLSGDMGSLPKDPQAAKVSKNIVGSNSTAGYWGYGTSVGANGTTGYAITANVENDTKGNFNFSGTSATLQTVKDNIAACTGKLKIGGTAPCNPANISSAYYALTSNN